MEGGDSPKLALIKQRVDTGYYNSDEVVRAIVDALLESFERRRALLNEDREQLPLRPK